MTKRPLAILIAAALPLLSACAQAPAPKAAPDLDLQVPDLEKRALLLLLVDRQIFDPLTVDQALRGGAALREDLAVTLGRVPDKRCRVTLTGLLIDQEPAVRRAAAFSLGLLGDTEAREALFAAERDADRETAVLAVEALGRLGTPVVDVAEQLLPLPDEERWRRLLPHLFRFKETAAITLAEHGLALEDPTLHAAAAYALARDPLPDAAPLLARLTGDPDPQVRAFTARGIGLLGAKGDLAPLRPLLDDPEPGPIVEALRAAGLLIKAGEPAPDDWAPRVLARLHDAHSGVRVTAVEAARYWLPDPPLGDALAEVAAKGAGRERGLAVLALALAKDGRAGDLAAQAAAATDPDVRARAVEAAVALRA
ncbi:MAG TPA: HEAT repeat domain-containing protein, partial [Thermoanaerobaculia bacterium]